MRIPPCLALALAMLSATACEPGTLSGGEGVDPVLEPDAYFLEPDAGLVDPGPDALVLPEADAGVVAATDAQPPPPEKDRTGCVEGDYLPYRGDLHTHTSYSDGEGTPAAAFKYARDTSGLDFLSVTDHVNKLTVTEYKQCKAAADAANNPGAYVAFCSYEAQFGGHGNFLFAPSIIPMPSSRKEFYNALVACTQCVGQFNHPGSDKFPWPDWTYNKAADARLHLIEMAGFALPEYIAALDAGWHVAPAWNSDTHSANWGSSARRTVIFAKQLSRTDLRAAMREHRTNAANDKNAALVLKADGCWMGSTLGGWTGATFTIEATDLNAGDGFKSVQLRGPTGKQLASVSCNGKTVCTGSHKLTLKPPTYVFALATQMDGNHVVSAPIWFAP